MVHRSAFPRQASIHDEGLLEPPPVPTGSSWPGWSGQDVERIHLALGQMPVAVADFSPVSAVQVSNRDTGESSR